MKQLGLDYVHERSNRLITDTLSVVIYTLVFTEGWTPRRARRFLARAWVTAFGLLKRYDMPDGAAFVTTPELRRVGIDMDELTSRFEKDTAYAEKLSKDDLKQKEELLK